MVAVCLMIIWSLLAIVGSATSVNQLIVASGGYETAATQIRTAMVSGANIPDQYEAVITQAFEKSITARQIETIVQPLIVDIVGWLDQPKDTPAPKLIVNLSPLKQQLASELSQAQVTEVEKMALVAQVAKQIPDQVDLAQAQSLVSQQGAEGSPEAAAQSGAALIALKSAYSMLQMLASIGLVLAVVLLAIVIFLARKDGRAMLRRPAWVFIIAGFLVAIVWVALRVIHVDQSQQSFVMAIAAARKASDVIIWYSLASIIVGAAFYGLSFLLKKTDLAPSVTPIAPPPTTPIQLSATSSQLVDTKDSTPIQDSSR